jgi:hypothetical protein
MRDPTISTLSELKLVIDNAWSDLEAFLAGVTEQQLSIQDDRGWTVTDHVTHMAVWEDSVAILFRGKPRYEALGVEESYYSQASFDQINERIRQRMGHIPTAKAVEELRQVHQTLMTSLGGLADADLGRSVRDYFPTAPRTDDRRVVDFIYENTAHHFTEHLGWMRALLKMTA